MPLEDKEVVLTFTDGPAAPYTNRVLDILGENCARRTTSAWPVGARLCRLGQAHPGRGQQPSATPERTPVGFDKAPLDTVKSAIETGIVSVGQAIGDSHA